MMDGLRPPDEDAYGDSDDEVLTYRDLTESEDPDEMQPIDILIAREERAVADAEDDAWACSASRSRR